MRGEVRIEPPNLLVGSRLENCVIGPHVYAEAGVTMEEGCEVRNSTLMEGTSIGRGAVVTDSMLGPGTVVEEGARVSGSILYR